MNAPEIPQPAAEKIPPTYADGVLDRRVTILHAGQNITCTTPEQAANLKRFLANPLWEGRPMPEAKK